ncbi:hypothetical protein [Natronospira bacteriovora]|uniref:Uncharacterized protein n=1 Tax=Natronospira bacteriovora TaxID=3069753 RepID=A0ABU0W6Y4_9GAMM|nr:hypothetical protein [Natronospira sp. AB-CW4]MDQ2069769.1 hypothetical protein [Natronospira sp. AB-CW4]
MPTRPRSTRQALALVLGVVLCGPVWALPHWTLEVGSSEARPGTPMDAHCDDPDSGPTRFLSCRRAGNAVVGSSDSWALGFDTPIRDEADAPALWWAGFRLGEYGTAHYRAELPANGTNGPDALRAGIDSRYALAQLRREWPLVNGRVRPYLAGGAGVARTSVREFRRHTDDGDWQAPPGDQAGYLLRLETGLIWQAGDRLRLGLSLRQDALDGWATPRGEGWVSDAAGSEPQSFEGTSGRLGWRSVVFTLSWPLGAMLEDVRGRDRR